MSYIGQIYGSKRIIEETERNVVYTCVNCDTFGIADKLGVRNGIIGCCKCDKMEILDYDKDKAILKIPYKKYTDGKKFDGIYVYYSYKSEANDKYYNDKIDLFEKCEIIHRLEDRSMIVSCLFKNGEVAGLVRDIIKSIDYGKITYENISDYYSDYDKIFKYGIFVGSALLCGLAELNGYTKIK